MIGARLLRQLPQLQLQSVRTFKSDLKIKWVRPVKIPSHKPQKSGDLYTTLQIDETSLCPKFANSKELETADESVRKIFSLQYNPDWHTHESHQNNFIDKVKRHKYDVTSVEATIAKWTGVIRTMQEKLETCCPKNIRLKVQLNEMIDRRKKLLKRLRKWDYKRFEWILEKLDIVYKPVPLDIHWVTRKDSLRKLTDKYCEDIKKNRLEEYKKKLQAEQLSFLEEKIRIMEFVREEQKACGVEVTVAQEEIDQVINQLNELRLRRAESEAEK